MDDDGVVISISLLAAVGTFVETGITNQSPLPALWSILAGLVVAHWFAFSLASLATGDGAHRKTDVLESLAGVGGALSVGLLVTLASWLVPIELETLVITVVLFIYIAIGAGTVARTLKAGWLRTIAIVVITIGLAAAIVALKLFFSG